MRGQGRISEWNDDRGFGFITPLAEGPRLFAHVSEFPHNARRPQVLDLVSFEIDHDERGRPRATRVAFMVPTAPRHAAPAAAHAGSLVAPTVAALVLVATLAVLVLLGRIPPAVFALYGFFSALAFVSYGGDKEAAQQHKRRVPESTLLLFGLLGGWPGAFLAQRVYRHKTRKTSFQLSFWLSVVANIAGLLLFALQAPVAPG